MHTNIDPVALPPRFLRLPDVMTRTGLQKSSIYDAVKKGQFPAPTKLLGRRAVGWSESSISAWITDRLKATQEG